VAAAGSGALGLSFIISLAVAIWGANAGIKAVFDAINVAYGAKEERGFFKLNLISLAFTLAAILFAVIALLAIVVVPISIHTLGLDAVASPFSRMADGRSYGFSSRWHLPCFTVLARRIH
jgi:membrane protein